MAKRHEFLVEPGFCGVDLWDQAQEPTALRCGHPLLAEEAGDALLAAGDLQKVGVQGRSPAPVDATGEESFVESLAVQLLRVGERAVDVKDQGVERQGSTTATDDSPAPHRGLGWAARHAIA